MTAVIRVLIVDDSPTLRFVTRRILEKDPELEVVGEAGDGETAVAMSARLEPDIITMDIRMPKMNGFEAIRHIMAQSPRPIVVLTTPESDKELRITFNAIQAGALTVLSKPATLDSSWTGELVTQLKTLAGVKVVRRNPLLSGRRAWAPPGPRLSLPLSSSRIVAIGASTGGPPALRAVLGQLPGGFPHPVVVVQHISPGFTKGFVRWLNNNLTLRVKVAERGEILAPGTVYVAPDHRHLQVSPQATVDTNVFLPVDGHRPSVTALFESVARAFGPKAIGVLLTGMGSDGARGLKAIREAGGRTIAQNEETCVVFGMPKAAVELGAAETVLPVEHIGFWLNAQASKRGRPLAIGGE